MENSSKLDPSELPFLVTHWLSNFQTGNDGDKDDAVRRLHEAASQMASAFSDLGMFGTANQPLVQRHCSSRCESRNASYEDVKRQWNHVPPNQLEMVAESAASVAASSPLQHPPSTNLFHVAQEIRTTDSGGRRLGETIDLTQEGNKTDSSDSRVRSILHSVPLLGQSNDTTLQAASKILPYKAPKKEEKFETKTLHMSVVSEFETIARLTGESMRTFLSMREEFRAEADEIIALEIALAKQEENKRNAQSEQQKLFLNQQHAAGVASHQSNVDTFARVNHLLQEIQNCDRVIAQLGIKRTQVIVDHTERRGRLFKAETEARKLFLQCKHVALRFRDPFQIRTPSSLFGTLFDSSGPSRNHLVSYMTSRQVGMSHIRSAKQIGLPVSMAAAKEMRKAVISARLSHSVTINAHLNFPVYCLQFDKTGRYFATGADDCLVKLFALGAAQSAKTIGGRGRTFTYGANGQGAILVCTLRGHAGVICDIDVSSDNAFVATASDDGDVRVWGMKDGSPIAILRGHVGGANMVSWSKLTPYRLVSSGMDGLARIWDVRDAALKRYGTHIGKRIEYTLPLSEPEKRALSHESEARRRPLEDNAESPQVMLPPLPPREIENHGRAADPAENVALPPAHGAPNNEDEADAQVPVDNNNENPGAFVANDLMDEGVRVVSKLQHGEIIQDTGPGTRSRRKQVKVICVARCPLGCHFATGSDDGLCRVWEDEDDERLALIDNRGKDAQNRTFQQRVLSTDNASVPSTARLLTTLVGHMSSITDLHYSYAGDRIVTASQKDGNARIWSFGDGSRSRVSQGGHLRNRFLDPKQIVLRLSNVNVTGAGSAQIRPSRRRGGSSTNNATTSVTCDVAVWTSDDTKIITSQSCPAKSNSQDIVPGSQLILVWDSWSGNCLLAIKQAHSQQCPVVISHPLEPSIMCSAGADGVAKVWDLENGRCLFYHKNVVDMGPIAQNNERGRESGYLDGAFDPHGHHLLLTDDNGRITIFDCLKGPSDILQQDQPAWMTEQYFANDYYELFYNTNGYCVERGSEQPPHLAPRAARCNHAGSAWSDDVSETFRMIKGPSPLSEISSASERTMLRAKMQAHLPGNDYQRRAVVMMDFDPDRTVQVTGAATMVATSQNTIVTSLDTELVENGATGRTRTTSSGRSLSSNYRWRDYDDLIHEEGLNDAGDIDVGDEEFVPRGVADDDDDPSDGLLSESEFLSDDGRRSVSRRSTRNRGATNARSQRANRRDNERARTEVREAPQYQPTRTSARRLTRTNDEESDDDEGFIEEVLSTNNAPTGPFADDYNVDGHLFKLASLSARVNRAWLLRTESSSSYKGRTVYSPQVGDSVVYIPRAHADTIREFPTLKAPWKNWPSGTSWPIVRCRVVNVRYRFPYKDYFRRTAETKCVSIVAILTLEITGIPELSEDREFPWPKPAFIDRQTRSTLQMFEVSVFESGNAEYVIPEQLFLWRLKCLEDALRRRANDPSGLKVVATYVPVDKGEDPGFEEYEAEVIQYSEADEVGDDQLNKSAFESLLVSWVDGQDHSEENLSPWDVTMPDQTFNTPNPPALTLAEKRAVANALRVIENTENFKAFLVPVDTRRYPDYLARVEVPIDTGTMKERLGQDFYLSTLSVLSDIKLIRENCLKYNGPDEIGLLAVDLYNKFKEVLKEELLTLGVDAGRIAELDEDTDIVIRPNHSSPPEENQGARTRASGATVNASSLERLPPPVSQPSLRTTRAVTRPRSSVDSRENSNRGRAASRTEPESNLGGETDVGRDLSDHQTTTRTTRRAIGNSRGGAMQNLRGVASVESFSEIHSRSTRATRSTRSQQGSDGRNEGMIGRPSARTARSHRPTKRARYDEDDDDDGDSDEDEYEEDSKDDDEVQSEDFHDEDDDKEEEDVVPDYPNRRSRRTSSQQRSVLEVALTTDSPRRQSSRSRTAAKYQDDRSDIEMRDEEDEFRVATRKTKENGKSRGRKKSPEAEAAVKTPSPRRRAAKSTLKYADPDSDDFEEEATSQGRGRAQRRSGSSHPEFKNPSRQPRLSRANKKYKEEDSDVDEAVFDTDEADDDDDDDESPIQTRVRAVGPRSSGGPKSVPDSVSRPSRRTKASSVTYQDIDSDVDLEQSDHDEKPRATNRSKRGTTTTGSSVASVDVDDTGPSRKRLRATSKAQKNEVPELPQWPSVSLKVITAVAEGILEEMRKLDSSREAFKIPVVEAFPAIKVAYRRVVKNPMDFRTIEEERLPIYESISQLQDDLILVFRNCVDFNGKDTEFGIYAIMLWEQLNHVFQNVCKTKGVKLPPRWNKP